MYKVFFDNRCFCLTDKIKFIESVQQKDGIIYKVKSNESIKSFIDWFDTAKEQQVFYLFHTNLEELFRVFLSAFKLVTAAGGIVENKNGQILVIRRNNKWDLPKGKKEKHEKTEQTALREVAEECGIEINDLSIVEKVIITYHTYRRKKQHCLKPTYWYRMRYSGDGILIPQTEEKITKARWISKEDLPEIIKDTYASLLEVFDKAAMF